MLPPETCASQTAPEASLTEAQGRIPLAPVPASDVVAAMTPAFADEKSRRSAPAAPREIAPSASVVLVPPLASMTMRLVAAGAVVSTTDWLLVPVAAPR